MTWLAVPRNVSAISADDQAARNTATQWLSVLDSGRYAQAYHEFAPRLRVTLTEENFLSGARSHRMPLGRARSRAFFQVKRTHTLIGNPDGDYEDIAFKTSFERKAQSVERLVLTKENGRWEILAYKIY
jgi:hypothetical protein